MVLEWPVFFTYLLALGLFVAFLLVSISVDRGDDWGDGLARVVLPPNLPTNLRGTVTFFLLQILGQGLISVLIGPLARDYRRIVVTLANTGVSHPMASPILSTGGIPVFLRFNILLQFLILAIVGRRSPRSRMNLLSTGVLYLLFSVLLDAVESLLATVTHLPIGPYSLEGSSINLLVAFALFFRAFQVSLALPRPTVLPILRPRRAMETYLTLTAIITVIVIAVAVGFYVVNQVGPSRDVILVVGFGAYPVFSTAVYLLLFVFGKSASPGVASDQGPPIDVIIPAYNESLNIEAVIAAIDVAAGTYPGTVRVIVCDDGSDDGTGDLVLTALGVAQHVAGEVVLGNHYGKGSALNHAFSKVKSEIVVRIDADTLLTPECFNRLPNWFSNPQVGLVGGVPSPRIDKNNTWFHRMRRLEALFVYGFNLPAQSRVDSLTVISGIFTAFRRDALLAVGGFLEGSNGEDADLTMQITRLGYRAVIDPEIRILEDVPDNLVAFREQRVRWNRATVQILSRHMSVRSGSAGPRSWYFYPKMLGSKWGGVARGIAPLSVVYILVTGGRGDLIVYAVGAFLVAQLVSVSVITALVLRFDKLRNLWWFVFWWPFSLLRRFIVVESLLTLPSRRDLFIERPETHQIDEAIPDSVG